MTAPSLPERGRRAGTAALLVVLSAGVAQAIVTNPEPTPAALFGPAPTVTAATMAAMAAPPGAASSPPTTAATSEATPATPAPPATTTAKPVDPRALAVIWYAERHGLDRSKVTALQADKLTGAAYRYRVLLLVTKPGGRLDSAVVTVTRSGGVWKVAGR